MNLSPNFTLAEFTKSQTAARRGISNQPTEAHIEAMKLLCANVLEPLRAAVGGTIVLNSGYRSGALNRAIGGSTKSQHSRGEAADIERPGISNMELCRRIIALRLPFDQLILEDYQPGVPGAGWVHVSHSASGRQRGQVLTATRRKVGRGMDYVEGLAA